MNLEQAPLLQKPQECQNVAAGRKSVGDERRQALVIAAYDLIATKGFEGLRVRDVAARGGVNIATLHYYFPSKEALISGVVQHLLHLFLTLAPRVPDGEEGTAAQRLERELIDMEYELQAAPQMWIVMMELQLRSLRDPAIGAIMKEMDDGWRAHIAHILSDGVRESLFRPDLDVEVAASTIIALLKGAAIQAISGFDTIEFSRLSAEMRRWIMSAILFPTTTISIENGPTRGAINHERES